MTNEIKDESTMVQQAASPQAIGRPLRLAQIGAGYWGVNLIRNFATLKNIEKFTVCDADAGRLEKMKLQYPHLAFTQNADEVIHSQDVDGVVIAVPAAEHYSLARQALCAGKHVFVEKPLTTRRTDAEDLVRLAAEKRRVLMVGHTFLYNDAVRKVKEYIDTGELGQIYYIFAQRLNLGKVREDVNAWWNLAPHDISIILYWLGETPAQITAQGFNFLQPGIDDVVFASMNFASGSAAHVHVSWLDPIKTRRIVVVGSKKMLVYDDVSTEAKLTLYDKGIDKQDIIRSLPDINTFGQFQYMHRIGDVFIPHIKFREPLGVECAHFVQCLREGSTPLTDGYNGLGVVDVLERAQNCLNAQKTS